MNVHRMTTLEKLMRDRDNLDFVLNHLLDHFNSPLKIDVWLNSPCPQFGGAIPANLIASGRMHKVVAYLKSVEDGW
jgi:hypothetical protein